MIVFAETDRRRRLRSYVGDVTEIRLFVNAMSPSETSKASDFEEPDAKRDGYAPMKLANWTIERIAEKLRATAADASWALTPSGTKILGWYALSAGAVIWSERFEHPFEAIRAGDELIVTVAIDDIAS